MKHGAVGKLAEMLVPIDEVVPDPANARYHPEDQYPVLMSSLERFGQRIPLTVQEKGMICKKGNGLLEAMRRLEWTHVAVLVVDESEVESTAWAIVDNQSGDLSTFEDEILAAQLLSLQREDFPMLTLGFSEDEVAARIEGAVADIPGLGGEGVGEGGFADEAPGGHDAVVEIPLKMAVVNNEDFKNALARLCEKWELDYTVRLRRG